MTFMSDLKQFKKKKPILLTGEDQQQRLTRHTFKVKAWATWNIPTG